MEQTELVVRLATQAENARDREELDLADLLDEAEAELELALAIVETVDTAEARAFMTRHSTPADPLGDACASVELAALKVASPFLRRARPDPEATKYPIFEYAAKQFHDANSQRRLSMLLDAARFVEGRDVVRVDETLIAMAWNAPHPDMREPDRVMAAGGYVRIGDEYRRQHNARVTGPKQAAQE